MATRAEIDRLVGDLKEVLELLKTATETATVAFPPGMHRTLHSALTSNEEALIGHLDALAASVSRHSQELDQLYFSGAALDVRLDLLEMQIEDYVASGRIETIQRDREGWIRKSARKLKSVLTSSSVIADSASALENAIPAPARLGIKGAGELFAAAAGAIEWMTSRDRPETTRDG